MKNIKSTSLFINGAIAIIIGFIFVFSADKAIEGILSVIGLVLSFAGIVILLKHFFVDKRSNPILLLEGFFNLAIGLILFINPNIMIHLIMFVIGIWAILIGIVQIVYFLKIKNIIRGKYLILSSGLIFIILGFFLITNPAMITSTIAIFIGFVIFSIGAVLIYLGYMINKNKEKFTEYKIVE